MLAVVGQDKRNVDSLETSSIVSKLEHKFFSWINYETLQTEFYDVWQNWNSTAHILWTHNEDGGQQMANMDIKLWVNI